LKIKYVEMEDAGVYSCRLESNDTIEWRNATVCVETPQNDGFQIGSEEPSGAINTLRTEEESNDLEIETRSKFKHLVNFNQCIRYVLKCCASQTNARY